MHQEAEAGEEEPGRSSERSWAIFSWWLRPGRQDPAGAMRDRSMTGSVGADHSATAANFGLSQLPQTQG